MGSGSKSGASKGGGVVVPLPTRQPDPSTDHQLDIFPVEITTTFPATGGVDSACTGYGADGMKYNIKTVSKTPAVPGAEWFCHRLAEDAQIAAFQPFVVLLQGEKAFGSRWQPAMLDQTRNFEVIQGTLPGYQLQQALSSLYAFDLFVHNGDRHLNNYAFMQIDGTYRLCAMDFSRAWTWNGWPPPAIPMHAAMNTVMVGRVVRKIVPFDKPAAVGVLNRMRSIRSSRIRSILQSMPDGWVDRKAQGEILAWWDNGSMTARVDALIKGLEDGTCL